MPYVLRGRAFLSGDREDGNETKRIFFGNSLLWAEHGALSMRGILS